MRYPGSPADTADLEIRFTQHDDFYPLLSLGETAQHQLVEPARECGRILRLVRIVSPSSTAFLTFTYDYYGPLKLIPRAMQYLDYTQWQSDLQDLLIEKGEKIEK